MTRFLLLVAPLFLVAPGIFMDRSSVPKMLSIAAGLCFLLQDPFKRRASAQNEVLAFLGVCLVSAIFSTDKWAAFAGATRAPYYGLFPLALVALAYLGSTELHEDEVDKALVAGGVLLAGFAIVQVILGDSLTGMPMPGSRAIGFRGSPVMLAASLVPCFLAAYHRARRDIAFRTVSEDFVAAILIFAGILAAKAKGAVLAAGVGIWVYEVSGAWRWMGFAFAVALPWGAIQRSNEEKERLELVKIAWRSFKQHPLLGWGPDCFFGALMANRTKAYDAIYGVQNAQASAHNDLAQVAATLGLAGVVTYWAMLRKLLAAAYSDNLAVAVLCAVIVQAQVNPVPTDILVVLAVLLGSRQRDSEGVTEIPSWVAPAVMGAAVVLALKDLTPWARGGQ